MYVTKSDFFRDFTNRYGYEDWKSHLEDFFHYFYNISEEMPSNSSLLKNLILRAKIAINFVKI